MRTLAAAVILLGCLVRPAQATEWLECGDPASAVRFRVLLGAMEVIAVITIEIEASGKKWSTTPGEGVIAITKGQAFETPNQIWIDVTDENVNAIVARLRLFKASEEVEGVEAGSYQALGGALQMPGIGAWAVRCSGP